MKKKKSQLVGGILLMILGLGVFAGSTALHFFGRSGFGPFNSGHKIVNRHGMNGNFGFNFQNPNRNNNQFKRQTPTPPSTPNPNQTPNQK